MLNNQPSRNTLDVSPGAKALESKVCTKVPRSVRQAYRAANQAEETKDAPKFLPGSYTNAYGS